MRPRSQVVLVVAALAAPSWHPMGGAARAAAPESKLVLLSLTFENVAPADQARIRQRLLDLLRAQPNVGAANPNEPALTGLDDRARIYWGKQYGAKLVVEAAVWYVQQTEKTLPEWAAALKVFQVDGGMTLGRPEEHCTNCKIDQFLGRVPRLVQEARGLEKRQLVGRLVVRAEPAAVAGANIKIDDRPMGKLPFDETLFVGRHEVTLEAEGYEIATEAVVLRDDAPKELVVTMKPFASTDVAPPVAGSPANVMALQGMSGSAEGAGAGLMVERRGPGLKVAGALAIVAGAALIGAGAYALLLDGKANCELSFPQRQCSGFYDTLAPGAGLVGAGGAAILAGAALLVIDHRRAVANRRVRELRPALAGGHGWALLGVEGRF